MAIELERSWEKDLMTGCECAISPNKFFSVILMQHVSTQKAINRLPLSSLSISLASVSV